MNYVDDLVTLLPELILVALVLIVITVDLFLSRANKWLLTPLTVAGLILAGAACVVVWDINETVYAGFYVVDDLSVFFKAATVVIGIISALFAPSYLMARRIPLGEFHMILVSALLGMFVLASSSDLITLFIGLELMTMPSYLLTGLHKTDRYSNEGGLKYFLLGSFASAIVLFGISWLYGLTGTTNIAEISAALEGQMSGALLVAIGFLLVGGTFKIAAVPFHYWTPDAYQGAPTPITGFLSVGPKLGAFALLIRVFAEALAPLRADWLGIFLVLTVLTMTVGNVVALVQVNVKRMLAYSSIAHTGYIMVGLAAYANAPNAEAAAQGISSVLFYVLGYAVMNIAAFAVVAMLQRDTRRFGGLNSFAGLASRSPARAAAMGVLMLSLTGIPPTVGFFAKLYVLLAAVDAGLAWLAVILVLNAAMAAFYYLRVVVYMYMRDAEPDPAPIDTSPFGSLALAISVAAVIALGLFPDAILNLVEVSAASIF
ncbi:MAG TPA: NADH-quinone oxidoreductase subunit N [Candidatus Limnocylindrales bacterium]|nr:NADH-quinone oxidoreductase subunit N [Candidatus Limnocylindrales bacterium]